MAAGSHPLDRAVRLALWGAALGLGLAAIKITAGWLGNSFALVADGLESCLDVVAGLVTWGGLHLARQPADSNHAYGHGKAEPLLAMALAVAILAGAGLLATASLQAMAEPQSPPEAYTLVVLVGVVLFKEGFARSVARAAIASGSVAVRADAWHHRCDAITSGAAFLGICIALLGGPAWAQADDWAALLACGVIGFNGAHLLRSALAEAMDAAPEPRIEGRVRELAASVPGVTAVEKSRLRRSGSTLFVDLHVHVPGGLSVHEGHRIAHCVKQSLEQGGLGHVDVLVHIEPDGP